MKKFTSIYDFEGYKEGLGEGVEAVAERILRDNNFRSLLTKRNLKVYKGNVVSKSEKYIQTHQQRFNNGTGIYINGELGVGKTSLAVSIIKEILINQQDNIKTYRQITDNIKFITANDYVSLCRNRSFEDRKYQKELVECDILVLDNLGNEYTSKNEQEGLFSAVIFEELLKARSDDAKPTFITSNLGIEQIQEKYNEVLKDVICQACSNIEVNSASIRKLDNCFDDLD